jgi:uncharacterized protein HemX
MWRWIKSNWEKIVVTVSVIIIVAAVSVILTPVATSAIANTLTDALAHVGVNSFITSETVSNVATIVAIGVGAATVAGVAFKNIGFNAGIDQANQQHEAAQAAQQAQQIGAETGNQIDTLLTNFQVQERQIAQMEEKLKSQGEKIQKRDEQEGINKVANEKRHKETYDVIEKLREDVEKLKRNGLFANNTCNQNETNEHHQFPTRGPNLRRK